MRLKEQELKKSQRRMRVQRMGMIYDYNSFISSFQDFAAINNCHRIDDEEGNNNNSSSSSSNNSNNNNDDAFTTEQQHGEDAHHRRQHAMRRKIASFTTADITDWNRSSPRRRMLLPPDTLKNVFSYLEAHDLVTSIELVCFHWHRVAVQDDLWQPLVQRKFYEFFIESRQLDHDNNLHYNEIPNNNSSNNNNNNNQSITNDRAEFPSTSIDNQEHVINVYMDLERKRGLTWKQKYYWRIPGDQAELERNIRAINDVDELRNILLELCKRPMLFDALVEVMHPFTASAATATATAESSSSSSQEGLDLTENSDLPTLPATVTAGASSRDPYLERNRRYQQTSSENANSNDNNNDNNNYNEEEEEDIMTPRRNQSHQHQQQQRRRQQQQQQRQQQQSNNNSSTTSTQQVTTINHTTAYNNSSSSSSSSSSNNNNNNQSHSLGISATEGQVNDHINNNKDSSSVVTNVPSPSSLRYQHNSHLLQQRAHHERRRHRIRTDSWFVASSPLGLISSSSSSPVHLATSSTLTSPDKQGQFQRVLALDCGNRSGGGGGGSSQVRTPTSVAAASVNDVAEQEEEEEEEKEDGLMDDQALEDIINALSSDSDDEDDEEEYDAEEEGDDEHKRL